MCIYPGSGPEVVSVAPPTTILSFDRFPPFSIDPESAGLAAGGSAGIFRKRLRIKHSRILINTN